MPVDIRPPSLTVIGDTVAAINDTLALWAEPADDSVALARYLWNCETRFLCDTTISGVRRFTWGVDDTGVHRIVVQGLSTEGLVSEPETVTVTVHRYAPTIAIAPRDTVAVVCDTIAIRAFAYDTNGTVDYHWRVDTGAYFTSGHESTLSLWWSESDTGRHVVRAYALDDDSLTSAEDSAVISIRLSRPSVKLEADIAAWVKDTVVIRAFGTGDGGSITRYLWTYVKSFPHDTVTHAESLALSFEPADAGRWRVFARSKDENGVVSEPDSAVVHVRLGRPEVTIVGDTVVWPGDSMVVQAVSVDENGTVEEYLWLVGEGKPVDTSFSDTLKLSWGLADTGLIPISVRVLDDDGLSSLPDMLWVRVRAGRPRTVAPPDTLVAMADTVEVAVSAVDTNGSIVKYYWGLGNNGWVDSTTDPIYRLWHRGRDPERLVVGAKDDQGLVGLDTMLVYFTNPSREIVILHPTDTNYVRYHDSTFQTGTVPFNVGCMDITGLCGIERHTLYLGTDPTTLS
ncbi:MAG: hypothetical protein GF363_00520, partial [Chitinivibrionales bacterium]|nr:hypothetical protein [Chitinivibrionales bacterium]